MIAEVMGNGDLFPLEPLWPAKGSSWEAAPVGCQHGAPATACGLTAPQQPPPLSWHNVLRAPVGTSEQDPGLGLESQLWGDQQLWMLKLRPPLPAVGPTQCLSQGYKPYWKQIAKFSAFTEHLLLRKGPARSNCGGCLEAGEWGWGTGIGFQRTRGSQRGRWGEQPLVLTAPQ